jgi:hypothetical protein
VPCGRVRYSGGTPRDQRKPRRGRHALTSCRGRA